MIYEKWYSLEPLKGYVINEDYVKIKTTLEMEIKNVNVNFIKKRNFILIIFSSKKPLFVTKFTIHYLLKNRILKKGYRIRIIGTEKGLSGVDETGITIGIPY